MFSSQHVYKIPPRTDEKGVDLIADVLPFGRLWYERPNAIENAVGYAHTAAVQIMPSSAFTI